MTDRHHFTFGLLAAIVLLAAVPVRAEPTAEQVWKKAEQRIKSTRDYTLSYNYNGPRGTYVFEYAVVRPDHIRTKVVKGEHRGAVLIYKPSEYGNEVVARQGIVGKHVPLDDPSVKGTPAIKPVFDMLLDNVRGQSGVTLKGNDTISGHAAYLLDISAASGVNEVAVDKATYDVLRWKYTDSEGAKERIFYDIKVNVGPRIDF